MPLTSTTGDIRSLLSQVKVRWAKVVVGIQVPQPQGMGHRVGTCCRTEQTESQSSDIPGSQPSYYRVCIIHQNNLVA
jgi:hypothetical protein